MAGRAGRVVVGDRDLMQLRGLLRNTRFQTGMDREHRLELKEELSNATVVPQRALPKDVVALGSKVLVRDLQTGVCNVYAIVSPLHANLSRGFVSVFAPLGTALLGFRTGDEVEWHMPGGVRRLKIEAVAHADREPEGPVDGDERLAA